MFVEYSDRYVLLFTRFYTYKKSDEEKNFFLFVEKCNFILDGKFRDQIFSIGIYKDFRLRDVDCFL